MHTASAGPRNIGAVHNIRFGPLGIKIHVDSIALDRSGSVLYFGALTGNLLLSISTSHLLHFTGSIRNFNLFCSPPFFREYPCICFLLPEKIKESPDQRDILEQLVLDQVKVLSREKPVTDGISCDAVGNLWLTTLEYSALSVAVPVSGSGEQSRTGVGFKSELAVSQGFRIVKVIENRELLRWPDGASRFHRSIHLGNILHLKIL